MGSCLAGFTASSAGPRARSSAGRPPSLWPTGRTRAHERPRCHAQRSRRRVDPGQGLASASKILKLKLQYEQIDDEVSTSEFWIFGRAVSATTSGTSKDPKASTAKARRLATGSWGTAAMLMLESVVAGASCEDVQRVTGAGPSQPQRYFGGFNQWETAIRDSLRVMRRAVTCGEALIRTVWKPPSSPPPGEAHSSPRCASTASLESAGRSL
jgi:hypothetical protein